MRALLDDASAVQHDDLVGIADRREAVRHHHDRLVLEEPVETLHDRAFVVRVQRVGRLVEEEVLRIFVGGPCDQKPKEYFISHNEVVYDNPSPGNKQGGITTLEDKSCGCVQKGGSAPIMDVIDYGEPVTTKGLNMLYGPGNDLVSATALTAAGAHMVLFSTGRGTPFGAPAPTLKIATNSQLAARKKTWIDFNAGVVADGERTLDEAGADLYQLVLDVASGKQTCAEKKGFREISIFKDGVVL